MKPKLNRTAHDGMAAGPLPAARTVTQSGVHAVTRSNCRLALFLLVLLSTLIPQFSTVFAQGSAFTYQGRLNDGGAPANGSYVFQFTVLDGANAVGTPVVTSPVDVSNGLFTVSLDFGAGVFTGAARWLSIEVHTNLQNLNFTALTPPQPILPTPYAIYAAGANAAGITGVLPAGTLSGSYSNPLNLTNPNNTYAGNGGGLTNVNAVSLGGLAAGNFWQTAGNAGTTAGVNFLGTTDNQPMEIKVNGQRVLRVAPGSSAPNLIGGYAANTAGPDSVSGVTIAGGGQALGINQVDSSWGTVGGGYQNFIVNDSIGGVIAGGVNNLIGLNSGGAVISGGSGNFASASNSVVGGGKDNWILAGATNSVIGGGIGNVDAGPNSFINGGENNQIGTNGRYSVVAGGLANSVNGGRSTIAGGEANQIDSPYSFIGSGVGNRVQSGAWSATISGGWANIIQTQAFYATIGGGVVNTIQTGADWTTIAGGGQNSIGTNSDYSVIGGGASNQVGAAGSVIAGGRWNTNSASDSFVGGGYNNKIQAGASYSVIGGGAFNSSQSPWTTIPGGSENVIEVQAGFGTISGGYYNRIAQASFGTISGGVQNSIEAQAHDATIAGGFMNRIESSAGASTIGGGSGNVVQTNAEFATIPGGIAAVARSYGQQVYASGVFGSPGGDAQASLYVLRGTTTNATQTEIFLDGTDVTSFSNRMSLPSNGLWAFDILVVAGRTDVKQDAGYQIKGIVGNVGGITLVKSVSPTATVLWEDDPSWDVSVGADSAHNALVISATGASGQTIRWVANVRTVEVIR
jgi:hypothetical protein